MNFKRQSIKALDAMNLKNLNDNFAYLWLKVFGNIETGDLQDGAVTGKKIDADTITARNIKAGTITADKIKTGELEVGKNIIMGDAATITWGQVTGTSQIPVRDDLTWDKITLKPTDLLTQSQLTTALTNYVTNGTMTNALANTLNTGNFSTIITKDYVASMNLIVGNEILMGANAKIDWNTQVNNKPSMYTDSQALAAWAASGYKTFIDSSGVYTGSITANQITSGSISASRISGGNLSLGGYNDSNGYMLLLGSSGQIKISLSSAGLVFRNSYGTQNWFLDSSDAGASISGTTSFYGNVACSSGLTLGGYNVATQSWVYGVLPSPGLSMSGDTLYLTNCCYLTSSSGNLQIHLDFANYIQITNGQIAFYTLGALRGYIDGNGFNKF